MNKHEQKILEELLAGKKLKDLIPDLKDLELADDLTEVDSLLRQLDTWGNEMTDNVRSDAGAQLQYALNKIQTRESEEQVAKSSKVESFWGNLNNVFWGWVIRRFGLLENIDEVLSPPKNKFSIESLLKPAFLTMILLGGVILALSILNMETVQTPKIVTSVTQPELPRAITTQFRKAIQYSTQVQITMNEETSFKKVSDTKIDLEKGSVWLDVERDGRGFRVITPLGLVRVTGTRFGVTYNEQSGLQIDVSEGHVVLERREGDYQILAGNYVEATPQNVSTMIDRTEGHTRPLWVLNYERDLEIEKISGLVAHWDMNSRVDKNGKQSFPDNGPHKYHGFSEGNRQVQVVESSLNKTLFGSTANLSFADKSWIEIPEPTAVNEAQQDSIMVMAWVKPRSFNYGYQRILSCSNYRHGPAFGFKEHMLDYGPKDKNWNVPLPKFVTVNKWIHVGVACESDGTIKYYLNGKLYAEGRKEFSTMLSGKASWNIGLNESVRRDPGDFDTGYFFDGAIDDLRIYNRQLTEEEIQKVSKIDMLRKLSKKGE